jgi:hypothetical protein
MQKAWREKEILKGSEGGSYIKSQLKEAELWPPEGKLKAGSGLPT